VSAFGLVTSTCMAHACALVYRSNDGLIGLHVQSGGSKKDRRRYFVWDAPDSAPDYASEADARQALVAEDTP
jgi:hypothetical protein